MHFEGECLFFSFFFFFFFGKHKATQVVYDSHPSFFFFLELERVDYARSMYS